MIQPGFIVLVKWAILFCVIVPGLSAQVVVYPFPGGEPQSQDYQVSVDGRPVFCHQSRAFDRSSTMKCMGRPVTPLTFASFDFQGKVTVTVVFGDALSRDGIDTSTVTIRPLAAKLNPKVSSARSITFELDRPCQLSIEPGCQTRRPLHLFANPLEQDAPLLTAPHVMAIPPGVHTASELAPSGGRTTYYFQPGVHRIPSLNMLTGQTVYIAGGAVVKLLPLPDAVYDQRTSGIPIDFAKKVPSLIHARHVTDVTIRGRGVLSTQEALESRQRASVITTEYCTHLKIEGVVVCDPGRWTIHLFASDKTTVKNIKIIGSFVNSDGLVIGGSSQVLVEDCFCHNADDAFQIKAWLPQREVIFRNCVAWSDVAMCFGIPAENPASLSDVLFERCTVIHQLSHSSAKPVVGIASTSTGKISRITFDQIVIEDVSNPQVATLKVMNNWPPKNGQILAVPTQPGNPYLPVNGRPDKEAGEIDGVVFSNIHVLNAANNDIVVMSAGPKAPITNISFTHVTINQVPLLNANDSRLHRNQWVSGLMAGNAP